jgi:hypothetical protein
MRELSYTLLAAQKDSRFVPDVNAVLTSGTATVTYDKTKIWSVKQDEQPYSHKTVIVLDNANQALTGIDYKGYKCDLKWGLKTASTIEYSQCSPQWIIDQKFVSSEGALTCELTAVGWQELLAEDRASDIYAPASSDTKTVKTLIGEIMGGTMACFNHCAAITVDWDSEDSLIDTYTPKDTFRVYLNSSRLASVRRLLDYTGCALRFENDGHCHIFVPQTSAATYDLPTSNSSTGGWANNANAYDDNELSYATCMALLGGAGALTLTMAAHKIRNHIKFKIGITDDSPSDLTTAIIEGYDTVSAAWFTIWTHTGYMAYQWVEVDFDDRVVSQLKITADGTMISNGAVDLFEIQLTPTHQYEYSLTSGDHTFFSKAYREKLVIPNYVKVQTPTGAGTVYTASTTDAASYALLPKHQYEACALANTAQALAIATAILGKYQMQAEQGSATVPINVGAEIYDYVKVTDSRENDTRSGNIGYLSRTYNVKKATWEMTFGFGGWYSVRGLMNELETSPNGTSTNSNYFERLTVKDLYVTNEITLDDIENGSTYSKVLSTNISAGVIKLLSTTVVDAGFTQDKVGDGSTYQRVLATNLSAGNIMLTSHIVASTVAGSTQWYNNAGVVIDANYGILCYGSSTAFRTRATSTGTDQCYMTASGQIAAGAGAILLDSNGILVKRDATHTGTAYLTFQNVASTAAGSTYEGSAYMYGTDLKLAVGIGESIVLAPYGTSPVKSASTGTPLGDNTNYWAKVWTKDIDISGTTDCHDVVSDGYVEASSAIYTPYTSNSPISIDTNYNTGRVTFIWAQVTGPAAAWSTAYQVAAGTAWITVSGVSGTGSEIRYLLGIAGSASTWRIHNVTDTATVQNSFYGYMGA